MGKIGNGVAFAGDGVGEYNARECAEIEAAITTHEELRWAVAGFDMPDRTALLAAFNVVKGDNGGDMVAVFEVRFEHRARLIRQPVECR